MTNKSWVLATLAAAAPLAHAENTVTLYGLVDAGYNYVSGLRGGSEHMLASGIMEGSRLGLRMNEDLGGKWRAIATLEHRIEADTGASSSSAISGSQAPDRMSSAALLGLPTALQPAVSAVSSVLGSSIGVNLGASRFWDRQIFVGLVTPVGAVLAGRQYTPAYEIATTFDVMMAQSSLAFGQVGSFPPAIDIRVSNAVTYRIESGPVKASAMVAAGEGSASTGRLFGAMAMYQGDAFSVGVGHNTRDNELGKKSLTSTAVGASVPVGSFTAFASFVRVKDDNPSGLSGLGGLLTPTIGPVFAGLVQDAFVNAMRQDARAYQLGLKWQSGPHTVYGAYNVYDDKRVADADVASYGAVYSYAFSKRTDVNFVLTRFENDNLAQTAPGGAGFIGGVTGSAGEDSTNVALGLRHRF